MIRAKTWKSLQTEIVGCEQCPRLRRHCKKVAAERRRSYRNEVYWGNPVSGFGNTNARLVVVGLAPAAHGANRTGRMFTGDRSGDWLYRALFTAGFANQPTSKHRADGLQLIDAFITATVKCAPPDNKPTPAEISRCRPYLLWELGRLDRARVYLALGKIGFDQTWNVLKKHAWAAGPRPTFRHGAITKLANGRFLLASYHPSQQNTFTGRLTKPMFDAVFSEAKRLISKD